MSAQEYLELGVKVETVVDNLSIPWSIDWGPDGTIFFTERTGNLRVIQADGVLQEKPLLSLDVGGVEGGMLGIAIDPNYSENGYIYLYYTYNEFISTSNKVVRYQINQENWTLTEDKVLIEGIPGGPFHDGGRIKFGPDGKLYITTGDAGNPALSQDLNSPAGKILRINSDGSVPGDNPYGDSFVYSFGHRNPQGIDWDNAGNLIATEHGPSGLRGVAHDEINLIESKGNYGWPDIIGDETKKDLLTPILHSGKDTWAPSGGAFYLGDKIPQWTGKYFVATLRGSHLHMIDFDLQSENKKIISHTKLFQDEFGRLRDVATGPDGFLYILTSNQDGRGNPSDNDDKILRISPINNNNEISSFEQCVDAGNPVMESFPKQCTTVDGLTFVEKIGACINTSKENPIIVDAEITNLDSGIQIQVEGCVDKIAHYKGINVTVTDPFGKLIKSGAIVAEPDGSFSLTVKDEFSKKGEYLVEVDANKEFVTTSSVNIKYYSSYTNTGISIEQNKISDGYWRNYFEYGDTIKGQATFEGTNFEPENTEPGTVNIQMTTPTGEEIIIVKDILIKNNKADFEFTITDSNDFKIGKYLLRPIYNTENSSHLGNNQEIFYIGQEKEFTYTGEGGPLDVNLQYIEYDVSPIIFDADQKSISFDFKKIGSEGEFTSYGFLQFESDIGVVIQRPLISPPYMVVIEIDNEDKDVFEYQAKDYQIKIIGDNFYKYKLSLDEKWDEGTITIIGTYVIPEFGQVVMIILTVGTISVIVLSTKFSTIQIRR